MQKVNFIYNTLRSLFVWGYLDGDAFFFIILFYGLFFSTVGVCTAARKGGAGFFNFAWYK